MYWNHLNLAVLVDHSKINKNYFKLFRIAKKHIKIEWTTATCKNDQKRKPASESGHFPGPLCRGRLCVLWLRAFRQLLTPPACGRCGGSGCVQGSRDPSAWNTWKMIEHECLEDFHVLLGFGIFSAVTCMFFLRRVLLMEKIRPFEMYVTLKPFKLDKKLTTYRCWIWLGELL